MDNVKLKGVHKKKTFQRTSHSHSLLSGERSSEKNNLSKIEKTGCRKQAFGPLALAPCFFQFLKDCFFRNSDQNETAKLVFFSTPFRRLHRREALKHYNTTAVVDILIHDAYINFFPKLQPRLIA